MPCLAMAGRARPATSAFGAEDAGRMPRPDGAPGRMRAPVSIDGGMLRMTDRMGPIVAPSMNFGHLRLVVADGRRWRDLRAPAPGRRLGPAARPVRCQSGDPADRPRGRGMTIPSSAFARAPPFAQGYVKDIRPRWALAEAGLP
jgi:hypothetical protein